MLHAKNQFRIFLKNTWYTFNAYLHAYIVIADYKQASQYSYWRCIKLYFFLFGIVQQTYHYYTHNL